MCRYLFHLLQALLVTVAISLGVGLAHVEAAAPAPTSAAVLQDDLNDALNEMNPPAAAPQPTHSLKVPVTPAVPWLPYGHRGILA